MDVMNYPRLTTSTIMNQVNEEDKYKIQLGKLTEKFIFDEVKKV